MGAERDGELGKLCGNEVVLQGVSDREVFHTRGKVYGMEAREAVPREPHVVIARIRLRRGDNEIALLGRVELYHRAHRRRRMAKQQRTCDHAKDQADGD
jgi:hypothetical protein